MVEKRDSSTNIDGPSTNSPISSGNFQGPVTYNYNINNYGTQLQQQLFEKKAPEYKRAPKPNFSGLKIFVGRQQDITKIKQYLTAESKNAPIAIVGEGGIGKTTLAFKAMHECQDMFDIIIPVYFESVLVFRSFLLEMAKSLQLPMSIDEFEKLDNVKEKAQIIKDALARYDRVLIYADNYETIRNSIAIINNGSTKQQSMQEEKENAVAINNFLRDVPENTCVLLTSRHRQNLAGERTIPLEGLSVQEGHDLFIEVAGDKLPKNIPIEIKNAIQEISRNTGGHPLSIEILASTYAGDLLPELKGMIEHLGAGDVNLEEEEKSRHKSLEACFEYSISKLPESHKFLLPKLALMFKSPFPASAVDHIFEDADKSARETATATAILRDLRNFSLIRRIDFDEYGDIEGKYRLYHFHPSVRNYLEHKVQQEEEEQNDKQQELELMYGKEFSLYYYRLLTETYHTIGKKDHALSIERFNVIWQGKDNDFDRAIRLAKERWMASCISSFLGSILRMLGRYNAALEYHIKALSIDEELNDMIAIAKDYNDIGFALHYQGNFDQALQYDKKALEANEKLQNRDGIANAYVNIAGVLGGVQHNYAQALEYLKEALSIYEDLQDKSRISGTYGSLGVVFQTLGNYNEALSYYGKALSISQELDNRALMASANVKIGSIFEAQGNHNEALSYYGKALSISQELNSKVMMAEIYGNIGTVFLAQGKYNVALEHLNKALSISEELQDKMGIARGYMAISDMLTRQGKYTEALEHLNKSLSICQELNSKVMMAGIYGIFGTVFQTLGNYNQALSYYGKILSICEELQDKMGIAMSHSSIGIVLHAQGNLPQALEHLNKALSICQELNSKVMMAGIYASIGSIFEAQGNHNEALSYYGKALSIYQELNRKVELASAYAIIGSIFLAQGNLPQALEHLNKALSISEELQDKMGTATTHFSIGGALKAQGKYNVALEHLNKALSISGEYEQQTGNHHPLRDEIRGYISDLQAGKEMGSKSE